MTDLTTTSGDGAGPNPSPNQARRRRLLVTGALAAVAVALAGGVAGAVAAVVSRSSTPSPSPSGAATTYFPMSGNQAAPNGASYGSSVASSGMAADARGAAGAPAALSPMMAQGPAMSSSLAYPYPGPWCGGAPSAPAAGPGITATGLAQVPLGGTPVSTQTLSVGVQSAGGASDLKAELADVQAHLAAIRDAIRKAGVPDDQITQQGLNVWGNGAPKVAGLQVNGNLNATITDPAILDRAVRAAVDAGASNLNVSSSFGAAGATPDDKTVQAAIAKATASAHTTAQAQAQAAGVSLGSLQSSQASPPSICGWAPGGAQMVVAVTLTYAVK
jgi:uncharacterized protein YggE